MSDRLFDRGWDPMSSTTVIRPWRPGRPIPADLYILGPTPEATLASIQDRLLWVAGRIALHRRVIHTGTSYADQTIWIPAARQGLATARTQFRALLRARRAVQQVIEQDAERVDAETKQ